MQFNSFVVLTMNVRDIGKVKILSMNEIPQDRLFALKLIDTPMEMLEKSFELLELALIDPRQGEKFKDMTPPEFYKFYRQWTVASRREEQKRKYGEFEDEQQED
jgi:hypothetical protein